MALPQHYLAALITPNGRLSQFAFALLAVVLAFANVWIYGQIRYNPQSAVWNPYTIALFVMIWMKFCIMSRRMHDTGSAGLILVPTLFLAVFAFLCAIDRDMLGADFGRDAGTALIVEHGTKIVRTLFIMIFLYLVRAGGEEGENAYGPEFGDGPAFRMPFSGTDEVKSAAATMDKLQGYQFAQHSYRRVGGPAAPQWGQRKRSGFGRR